MADPVEPASDQTVLSEDERKRIVEWVNKHHAGKACAVCDQRTWTLGAHLVAPPVFKGGLILGGTAYPQAMLLCRTCGNTLYFNAVIMGLAPQIVDHPPKAADAPKDAASDG